jgi:signal transduction histidine kinase
MIIYAKLFINKHIRFKMYEAQQFVQYTGDSGDISICVEENNKEKRLLIQDSGIGIKSEDIHRVFDKGFTGSTGRSHAKSTGMGLYLARQLAMKLGHELSIQSEEGIYTKLIIHFPKIRNYYHL